MQYEGGLYCNILRLLEEMINDVNHGIWGKGVVDQQYEAFVQSVFVHHQ